VLLTYGKIYIDTYIELKAKGPNMATNMLGFGTHTQMLYENS